MHHHPPRWVVMLRASRYAQQQRRSAGMLTDDRLAELAAAAHAGSLLMDEKNPGWENLVDPDVLYMQSIVNCVLGQSMSGSSYLNKVERLGIAMSEQVDYGFALPVAAATTYAEWHALGDAWRHEIAIRVAPTTPVQVDGRETLVLVA